MGRYQEELIALAREIAEAEGVPLEMALEQAAQEIRPLVLYAFEWDKRAAHEAWAQIAVTPAA